MATSETTVSGGADAARPEVSHRIELPAAKRGRKSAAAQAVHDTAMAQFYAAILEMKSRLDFAVSARGWCYLMEQAGAITKAEFDRVESLINEARKAGDLPLNICAVDETRRFDCMESVDTGDFEEYLAEIRRTVDYYLDYYRPFSFWENKPVYLEMLVEKIDLKSLFERICRNACIPLANAKGWPDIHVRAAMMERFKQHEAEGQQCVLLYCGDHDPAGLHIADSYRAMFEDIKCVRWRPDNLIIDRFGIDADFIAKHNLSWIDNLITGGKDKKDLADPKHPDHFKPYVQDYISQYGARKVEANAMVTIPTVARQLCRDAIEKYLGDIDKARGEFDSRLELPRREVRRIFAESLVSTEARQ